MRFEVGMRFLCTGGWRPDGAMADVLNVTKALPPVCEGQGQVAIGSLATLNWVEVPEASKGDIIADPALEESLDVRARAFFEKGYGFPCSYQAAPDGRVFTQGWLVGFDPGPTAPVYLRELGF